MYVKVRTMDGRETSVITISKLTTVEDFRDLVNERFSVLPDRQRLFYRGKQMENDHNMFDYNVNVNDVIQLMVKPVLQEVTNIVSKLTEDTKVKNRGNIDKNSITDRLCREPSIEKEQMKSEYYRVGDLVDAQYIVDGTWWEAKIIKIIPNDDTKEKTKEDDGFIYSIQYENYDDTIDEGIKLGNIRPRARTKISFDHVKTSTILMVNYNLEDPEQRGFWYDCEIKRVIDTRNKKAVVGTIYIGGKTPVDDCHIFLVDELFKIEENVRLGKRDKLNEVITLDSPVKRESGPGCKTCKDNPKRKCKDCGCHECHGKENPNQQLMCDECDVPFHLYCLDPPLESIPDVEEWFCPLCKNDDSEIVRAGEKLKSSKKKMNAKGSQKCGRDWGKGMACAGRQKQCTMVPSNHFGPVPGVDVGQMWKFRVQASECGVHRPPVSGIHGRDKEGAYSIALSGGYEDDVDNGDEFFYTGAGGRDLSGNKRTAEQSCDQELTRSNRALALNCNVPLNVKGAEATKWKGGKPVRVVRNCKLAKHSKYAPEEGNRYDGIYKVVKYWQEKGQSGFKVWRYLFRRDDQTPAPWTKAGRKRIEELGFEMVYPEGYLEAQAQKGKDAETLSSEEDDDENKNKRGKKRKLDKDTSDSPMTKKTKTVSYKLDKDTLEKIDADSMNKKLWADCKIAAMQGKTNFITTVEDQFLCICCQILVHKPITTPCKHNVCLACLHRSFKADVYSCPACRHELGKEYDMSINETLRKSLLCLFPGYEAGR